MSDTALTSRWRQRLSAAAKPSRTTPRAVSFFEFWPGWLFYAPVFVFWIIQSIRHRSVTLPALANPRIDAGGICGESKNAILAMAGPAAAPWIATYVAITTTGHRDGNDLAIAEIAMSRVGLTYPLVVKPDMSCNGVGVRIVDGAVELGAYLAAYPRASAVQLQELITLPGEAGIFYIRHPEQKTGRITSVTLKFPPEVTGDGISTIRQLIAADFRLSAVARLLLRKLGPKADEIPAAGETRRLVFVGNHCRGSTFHDGIGIVTPALAARIDAIVQDLPELYFTRLDLRYGNLDDLRAGKNFKIIEFNGSGSEATHIWDPQMTLREAYAAQFFHYGESFRIGAQIRKSGGKPPSLFHLWSLWRQQKRLMAAYPSHD